MAPLALEIDDAGLLALARGRRGQQPGEPGAMRFVEGERVLVGAEAAARGHLKPRLVHDPLLGSARAGAAGPAVPAGASPTPTSPTPTCSPCAERCAARHARSSLAVPGFWSTEAAGSHPGRRAQPGCPCRAWWTPPWRRRPRPRGRDAPPPRPHAATARVVTALTRRRRGGARAGGRAVDGLGLAAFERRLGERGRRPLRADDALRSAARGRRGAGPARRACPSWLLRAAPRTSRAGHPRLRAGASTAIELTRRPPCAGRRASSMRALLAAGWAALRRGRARPPFCCVPGGAPADGLARPPAVRSAGADVVELPHGRAVAAGALRRPHPARRPRPLPLLTRSPPASARDHRAPLPRRDRARPRGRPTHPCSCAGAHADRRIELALGTAPPRASRGSRPAAATSSGLAAPLPVRIEAARSPSSTTTAGSGTFVNGEPDRVPRPLLRRATGCAWARPASSCCSWPDGAESAWRAARPRSSACRSWTASAAASAPPSCST